MKQVHEVSGIEQLCKKLEKHSECMHKSTQKAFFRNIRQISLTQDGSTSHAAGINSGVTPWANSISCYRFVQNNAKAPLDALREMRAKALLENIPLDKEILVIHDISELNYQYHSNKTDRRAIGDGKGLGYEYNACLGMELESERLIGMLHDCVVNNEGPDDKEMMDYKFDPLFDKLHKEEADRLEANHKHQMAVHIHGTREMLAPWKAIDVADREFDDAFLFLTSRRCSRDFVIRATGWRNVIVDDHHWIPENEHLTKQQCEGKEEGEVYVKTKTIVEHLPMNDYKTLYLDSRGRVTDKSKAARSVELEIGAVSVKLYRPAKRNKKYFKLPSKPEVNLVVIREKNPEEGKKPLLWLLLTSLPINTKEELAKIGRIYELRWKIEEYFRLMKAGLKLEQSRFKDANIIARYIILLTLSSTVIFNLRVKAGLPDDGVLTERQYHSVKQAMQNPNDVTIEINLRLFAATARFGGWPGRKNDPIGSAILMRGIQTIYGAMAIQHTHAPLLNQLLTHCESTPHSSP
jgi:hypothetical protein